MHTYKRLNCKCWRCRVCAEKRAAHLRRTIAETAQTRGLTRLLTLTLDPRSCAPEASVAYIRRCFNKLRTYLKREFGQSISYIAIVEFQKSGYAHMHVLVDRFIAQAWIKSAWRRLGGGSIVDIRWVDVNSVAAYLAGYFGKGFTSERFQQRERRYSSSRDIALTRQVAQGCSWLKLPYPIHAYRARFAGALVDEYHDREGVLQWFRIAGAIDGSGSHPTAAERGVCAPKPSSAPVPRS